MTDEPETEDDLQVIAEQVWSSYLDRGRRPARWCRSPCRPRAPGRRARPRSPSSAPWRGHVLVTLLRRGRRASAAAALLGIALDEVAEDGRRRRARRARQHRRRQRQEPAAGAAAPVAAARARRGAAGVRYPARHRGLPTSTAPWHGRVRSPITVLAEHRPILLEQRA